MRNSPMNVPFIISGNEKKLPRENFAQYVNMTMHIFCLLSTSIVGFH